MKNNEKFVSIVILGLYIAWLLLFASTDLSIINFVKHFTFLGLIVALNFEYLKESFQKLKNDKKKILWFFIFFICIYTIMFFGGIIQLLISSLGLNFEDFVSDTSNQILIKLFSEFPWGSLFSIFVVIFFTAIVEEIVYRKCLRSFLNNNFLFVVLSSLLVWYFQVTLTNPSIAEFINTLPIFLISIFLSIIYVKKDNIWYTIIPRMLYNIAAFLIIILL